MVCLGGGPSLTGDDVQWASARADAIVAINNSYQLAPKADVLYAADAAWWTWHSEYASHPHELVDPRNGLSTRFTGLRYCLQSWVKSPSVQVLQNTGERGLETQPTGLRTGKNSGFQAINLAVHLGATRILLLGYDMQVGLNRETHWHGDHPRQKTVSPYATFLTCFPSLVEPLKQLGVDVINCSRRTALDTFPCLTIQEALS